MLCWSFFTQFLQLSVRELNLEGWRINEVNRNAQSITFDQSPVRSCDLLATNVIVHSVNNFSHRLSRDICLGVQGQVVKFWSPVKTSLVASIRQHWVELAVSSLQFARDKSSVISVIFMS